MWGYEGTTAALPTEDDSDSDVTAQRQRVYHSPSVYFNVALRFTIKEEKQIAETAWWWSKFCFFLTRTLGQLGVSAHVEHLLCCQIRTILSSTYNKQRQIWVLHIRTGSSQADQIKTPPSSLGGHPLNHNTNIHTYTTFNMRYSDFKTCNHV